MIQLKAGYKTNLCGNVAEVLRDFGAGISLNQNYAFISNYFYGTKCYLRIKTVLKAITKNAINKKNFFKNLNKKISETKSFFGGSTEYLIMINLWCCFNCNCIYCLARS